MQNHAQNNAELIHRSLSSVWHPCSQMKQYETFPLIPLECGKSVWLYNFEGNRYLDAVSSWWVNLFGHCNPRINAALKDQLERLEHAMLAGFTHEPVIEHGRSDTDGRCGWWGDTFDLDHTIDVISDNEHLRHRQRTAST